MQIYKIDPQLLIYLIFFIIWVFFKVLKGKPQSKNVTKEIFEEEIDPFNFFKEQETQTRQEAYTNEFTPKEPELTPPPIKEEVPTKVEELKTEETETHKEFKINKQKKKFNLKEAVIYSEILKPKKF